MEIENEINVGRIPWNKGKKGLQIAWNKGIPQSLEQRKNHSEKMKGKIPPNKGIPMSNEQKKKISKTMIGKGVSKGEKNPMFGISLNGEKNGMYGKKHNEETKKKLCEITSEQFKNGMPEETKSKLRKVAIERMNKQKVIAAYNPKACNFIEVINQKLNICLKHALNGGEEIINGYYLDGYDKNRNIVFEYDEPHHYSSRKRQEDLTRQNILIDALKPKMFLRYNEENKELVDVITNSKINL